jgi:hypothetical protein
MELPVITDLSRELCRHVGLGKSRLETLSMLVVGMISARTVNLVHVADERGSRRVDPASTYRRLQRFFQHVRLPDDWAAPMIAGLAGGAEERCLVMDRTNWKIGETCVNLLVLAVKTRHSQVPLIWRVLDRPGNSGACERIELMDRYIALFGKASIAMLLADREFNGEDWLNYLVENDIPFTIRMKEGCYIQTAQAGHQAGRWRLSTLLTGPARGRKARGTLKGMRTALHFAAKLPKSGEPVIVATNRPDHDARATYRKRWAIEQLFGNAKTRGLNVEDTRLTCPAKLHLLTAILGLAIAWAVRAARTKLGQKAPPRKAHGYFAASYFRTGFTFIRNRLRANPLNSIPEWQNLKTRQNQTRVV